MPGPHIRTRPAVTTGCTHQDPAHDRHRLRLLIKRARYGDEAYPQLDHAGKQLRRLLKQAQGDLGDWHDRLQWLLQARDHADLALCKAA